MAKGLQAGGDGPDPAAVELWLWHGSNTAARECEQGFDVAYASLEHNVYGAGVYFARDPRLPHHFARQHPDPEDGAFRLLLCRVVVGIAATKRPIQRDADVICTDSQYVMDGFGRWERGEAEDMERLGLAGPELEGAFGE